MRYLVAMVVLGAAVAALGGCGGNGDDGGGSDAGMSADAMPGDAMTGDAMSGDAGAGDCELDRLLVSRSNFQDNVSLARFDIPGGTVTLASEQADDQDSVPDRMGCAPVVLERTQSAIDVQSSDLFTTERTLDLDPASPDAGAADGGGGDGGAGMPPPSPNPQDVLRISSTKAYVAPLGLNAVLIVDPTESGQDAVTGRIDLSRFLKSGDEDGSVDPTSLARVDDRLYVSLGNYWFDMASGALQFEGSEIAVIDPSDDTLVDMDDGESGVQPIALTGDNPFAGMVYDEARGRLLVGTVGRATENEGEDAGIEAVDPSAGESTGYVLTEADVGAPLAGFELASETRGYVRTQAQRNPDFTIAEPADVRVWDREAGTVESDPLAVAGALLEENDGADGILVHEDVLYVWSETDMFTFDAASGDETTPSSGPYGFGDAGVPITGVEPVP